MLCLLILLCKLTSVFRLLTYKVSTCADRLQLGGGDNRGDVIVVSNLFLPLYSLVAAGSPKEQVNFSFWWCRFSNPGPCPRLKAYVLNSCCRVTIALWSSFPPLPLSRKVSCLLDMQRVRELLGLTKSVAQDTECIYHWNGHLFYTWENLSIVSIIGSLMYMPHVLQSSVHLAVLNF
jgi:hypothetical protein